MAKPIRVLMVGSDDCAARKLRDAITRGREQVQVESAVGEEAARRALRAGAFDCIVLVLDQGQPGWEVTLERVAGIDLECPVVVVSPSSTQRVAVGSIRGGGGDFVHLSEAVHGERLWRRIRLAAETAQKQREDRRRTQRRLTTLATLSETDPLTRLGNRRRLEKYLHDTRRKTLDRRDQVSVFLIDLDHLKEINDAHGHGVGDEAIKTIGQVLAEWSVKGGLACRWGGDEFLVIRPKTRLPNAVRSAEHLRQRIRTRCAANARLPAEVTVSIGLVAVPAECFGESAIVQADDALYVAKQRGRNRVCTWHLAAFQRIAHGLSGEDKSAREKLACVVGQSAAMLGATQLEHLSEHSQRVGDLAAELAGWIGISASATKRVQTAGVLHDLGKYLVPESVLSKPGPLTPEERFLMQRIARDGADMARSLVADPEVSELIGGGRESAAPIDGEAPPGAVGGQLVRAADAYASLTTNRPYRRRRSKANALRVMSDPARDSSWARILNGLAACTTGKRLNPLNPPPAKQSGD